MFKKVFLLVLSLVSFSSFSMRKRPADFDREEKRVEASQAFIKSYVERLLIKGNLVPEDFSPFLNEKQDLILEFFDVLRPSINNDFTFFEIVRWFLNSFYELNNTKKVIDILNKYKEDIHCLDIKDLLVKVIYRGDVQLFLEIYKMFPGERVMFLNFLFHGYTPLSIGAKKNNLEILQVLLDLGADVNFTNERGFTPLMRISEGQKNINLDVLRFLLKKGANPNLKDQNGESVFHKFLEFENCVEAFEILLENSNFDINATYKYDALPSTYLIYLVRTNDLDKLKKPDLIKLFLKKSADYTLMDRDGYDALYYAIIQGLDEVVIELLNCGAKFFKQDFDSNKIEAYFDRKNLTSEVINLKHLYLPKKSEESVKQLAMKENHIFMNDQIVLELLRQINNWAFNDFQINLKTLDHLYYYRAHFLDKRTYDQKNIVQF